MMKTWQAIIAALILLSAYFGGAMAERNAHDANPDGSTVSNTVQPSCPGIRPGEHLQSTILVNIDLPSKAHKNISS
jgi:hypothetical protein